jgi:hypothetical protein
MKVRIPFVISASGKWAAYGYPNAQQEPDWAMVEEVADNGEEWTSYQRGWITVDLPQPKEVVEVDGVAVTARDGA